MKLFVPVTSSQDSVYLLYKLLIETHHNIIARIFTIDVTEQELSQHRVICEWLSSNVRKFDYGISLSSDNNPVEEVVNKKAHYTVAWIIQDYAEAHEFHKHKADKISIGFNAHNWHPTNWFYRNMDKDASEFYWKDYRNMYISEDDNPFMGISIEWPLLNKDFIIGRFETWERIPEELQKLVAVCPCKRSNCYKCQSWKWYFNKKGEGFSAAEIDDLIMKEGGYGKYFTKESNPKKRHAAYINIV